MEQPFVYDRSVSGKNFLGRKLECNALTNLLSAGEHISVYGRPRSGKKSLIQQSLFNMKMMGRNFIAVQIDLSNVRTLDTFLMKFARGVIKAVYSTAEEYEAVVNNYLADTHMVFDRSRFATSDEVVSLNWASDLEDFARIIRLPQMIAQEKGVPYYVIIKDFQNLMSIDDFEKLFKIMEDFMRERPAGSSVSYILTGSQLNAMKLIFEERRFFYRLVNNVPLTEIEDREIIEYVVKGFMVTGKVIEKDMALGVCKLFRNDMWYLNHFFSIADKMTRGFVNETILLEALNIIISIHEPYFKAIMNDLTNHQISLLKAVLDGVIKFSASDVIEKYALNSSANVRRVKDALKKKEVLTFNEKDEPVIIDPLFEYWVGKYYFERN